MRLRNKRDSIVAKRLESFNWLLFALVSLLVFIGVVLLYSAGGLSWDPWAGKQLQIGVIFLFLTFVIAITDFSFFFQNAYRFYVVGLILLLIAEVVGYTAMGAQRWIRIGPLNFQPSELMKVFVILVLARYFHQTPSNMIGKIKYLMIPIALVLLPVAFILKQPNLGTSMIIILISAAMFFAAGVRIWKFVVVGIGSAALLPVVWYFMHDYQKRRVLTFLNPDSDPLGAGYNIIQSLIAIGSGGAFGRGYAEGPQNQLNFLPEKHTDFIFTVLAEELGFVAVLAMFSIVMFMIVYTYLLSFSVRHEFGRLAVVGCISMFFFHILINSAMIAGFLPVVGVPFPLLSYGGSNLISSLLAFSLILSALNSKESLRK